MSYYHDPSFYYPYVGNQSCKDRNSHFSNTDGFGRQNQNQLHVLHGPSQPAVVQTGNYLPGVQQHYSTVQYPQNTIVPHFPCQAAHQHLLHQLKQVSGPSQQIAPKRMSVDEQITQRMEEFLEQVQDYQQPEQSQQLISQEPRPNRGTPHTLHYQNASEIYKQPLPNHSGQLRFPLPNHSVWSQPLQFQQQKPQSPHAWATLPNPDFVISPQQPPTENSEIPTAQDSFLIRAKSETQTLEPVDQTIAKTRTNYPRYAKKNFFTAYQLFELCKRFSVADRIVGEEKEELAAKIRVSPHQIAIWFKNKRNEIRKKLNPNNYKTPKYIYPRLRNPRNQ
ncbi:hypothetical protein CRE_24209 [Caenorhabditis remanei]|uniref:Uncharacterized protein n=1 Tax=Caenorhabditis remanei TaxID=31234 RepID=E3NCX9_CAERE|nr:hypothetical protein CRE_24209 [Caenorhabditis remanei]